MIQQAPHGVFHANTQARDEDRPNPRRRFSHILAGCAFAFALSGAGGCGGARTPHTIPRTLKGTTQLTPFVQPFSYETYVRGELALSRGAFQEAATQLDLSTGAPDEDPYLLSRLAYAQARAGKRQQADETLQAALRLDPCSEAVWLTRAELAELEGKLNEALLAYRRASECAPRSSRGPLGRARALYRAGKPSEALEALGQFSGPASQTTARLAFEAALQGHDPAVLAHAFETWLAYKTPDEEAVVRAAAFALARGLPSLAQRLRAYHTGAFPVMLEAQIMHDTFQRAALSQLIEQVPAEELGGSQATAELAFFAGSYERAELEATTALARDVSDELHALRARARWALGQHEAALADIESIRAKDRQSAVLLDLLAADGNPGLAQELGLYFTTRR